MSIIKIFSIIIARNSEPDKADARDSLSIKNFVFLAFDWSINFKNVIWRARVQCNMATRDRPASGFFRILNKVSTADAEFLVSSPLSVKRRRSSGPLWEVERLVDKRERNGTVSCPA